MSKNTKFELNKNGVIELFTSPEVESWLQSVGNEMADTASGMSKVEGAAYGARSHNAGRTAICNVYPDSKEAAKDNFENNTLLKARGALGLPSKKPKLPK